MAGDKLAASTKQPLKRSRDDGVPQHSPLACDSKGIPQQDNASKRLAVCTEDVSRVFTQDPQLRDEWFKRICSTYVSYTALLRHGAGGRSDAAHSSQGLQEFRQLLSAASSEGVRIIHA